MVNYSQACTEIISAAGEKRSFAMTALATHGLMESVSDPQLSQLINQMDLVTPDGQPVRWAMNLLYGLRLKDRVCGPDLTRQVCEVAAQKGIGIYLFGSSEQTVNSFSNKLKELFPDIIISGLQADRFREATPQEDQEDIIRINKSGAGIVLVGRGCPRQERWVAEHHGKINAAMMAVGAAFDYFAGNLKRAPRWMQRAGLEWLFRLIQEPRRLFRRYLTTNSYFLFRLSGELLKTRVFLKKNVSNNKTKSGVLPRDNLKNNHSAGTPGGF